MAGSFCNGTRKSVWSLPNTCPSPKSQVLIPQLSSAPDGAQNVSTTFPKTRLIKPFLPSNSSKKLDLSVWELLCYSFSCKKDERKFKLFSFVKKEIESSLEVSKKIKLYKEFDLLMSLLLNKNEQTAFRNQNYLFFKKSSNQIMDENKDVEEMIQYFKQKIQSGTLTERDNQFLNSLKSNLTERIIFQN